MHWLVARFFSTSGREDPRTARRRHRLRGVATTTAIIGTALLLSSCSVLDTLLPKVRWIDSGSGVRLALYLQMSPIPDVFEDEAEASKVALFTGSVETGGSYTFDDVLQCEFDLAADAAFALDLVLGTYLDGFSGTYGASGEGFNNPVTCTYETYALFEWVIEFEVLEAVTMQVLATLYAAVFPSVVGQSLHYVLVRQKSATEPLWIGRSEEDEADTSFEQSIGLEPGRYEFAVYARPRLLGTSGDASLESGWVYAVTFGDVDD
jgi:hypothetical protein